MEEAAVLSRFNDLTVQFGRRRQRRVIVVPGPGRMTERVEGLARIRVALQVATTKHTRATIALAFVLLNSPSCVVKSILLGGSGCSSSCRQRQVEPDGRQHGVMGCDQPGTA
jgi:hypothetical protein